MYDKENSIGEYGFLDENTLTILNLVKEHNNTGDEIYWKKLRDELKGKMSHATINKKIKWLVECGIIYVKYVPLGRATFKYLYVKDSEEVEIESAQKEDEIWEKDLIDMMLENQRQMIEMQEKMRDMIENIGPRT